MTAVSFSRMADAALSRAYRVACLSKIGVAGVLMYLGLGAVQGATAESSDSAPAVEYRDHEASEEEVADVPFIVATEQTRLGCVPQICVQGR